VGFIAKCSDEFGERSAITSTYLDMKHSALHYTLRSSPHSPETESQTKHPLETLRVRYLYVDEI